MILSSSACSAPRNLALDVSCDFLNDTMDMNGSNNASESSLSPSLTLQSPPPYKTHSYEFPILTDNFTTDDDVMTTLESISSPATSVAIQTTNRTNEARPSQVASIGNDVAFSHISTLATSTSVNLHSPPSYQTRSFSVGSTNHQRNFVLPVRDEPKHPR